MWQRLDWQRRRLALAWEAAGVVRERGAFFGRELVGRRSTGEYALKQSGMKLALRHPWFDVAVLYEVFVADAYAFPEHIARRLRDLGRPAQVLDLGGNIGLFALRAYEQLPGARVVSFEPDPANLSVLRRCAALNPALDWEIIPAAAGRHNTAAAFISDFAWAQLAEVAQARGGHIGAADWIPERIRHRHPATRTVEVEVKDMFPYCRQCDLLKIDIEGAEWDLLADPRFHEISALAVVIEAHPPPGAVGESLRSLDDAFSRAGLTWSRTWTAGQDADLAWAWRE
jgi:FkbM family methyltransferase